MKCSICGKSFKIYDEAVQIKEGIISIKDEFLPETEFMVLHAKCFQEVEKVVETLRD